MNASNEGPGGNELLVVGKIIRPHGIRGAVIVAVESDRPEERFREGASLVMEVSQGEYREVMVESSTPHRGGMLVFISGVEDRDGAEELRGRLLMVRAADAGPLEEGEYWAHDLVGMTVMSEDGRTLGEVVDVTCRRAQDLLSVQAVEGTQFQVPFVEEFVKSIDGDSRVVTVKMIDGMGP